MLWSRIQKRTNITTYFYYWRYFITIGYFHVKISLLDKLLQYSPLSYTARTFTLKMWWVTSPPSLIQPELLHWKCGEWPVPPLLYSQNFYTENVVSDQSPLSYTARTFTLKIWWVTCLEGDNLVVYYLMISASNIWPDKRDRPVNKEQYQVHLPA